MNKFVSFPPLPSPIVTGTQGIFAQKRKGKSYTAQTQAEDLLEAHQQIAAIDPTSAWWGIRSSADGKSPGYPVTIFGGEHGDAPLDVKAGALIAEAMVTERFSAVLDLSLLDPEEWPVVAGDFLDKLYSLNRHPMHVFLDEADQFAPQTPEDKAQQKCRRVVNRVVRLGGIRGIGCTVITQRTAVLDKSILSQCDTIVALQMNGARDLDALRKELGNHTSRDVIDEVIGSLGDLPRGHAWVLTPGTRTFARVRVRAKRTFDSGRTPDAGETIAPPKALAAVDLKRLGKAIAASMDKAKANDPAALRERIRELEAKLSKSHQVIDSKIAIAKAEVQRVEVPAIKEAELKRLERAFESMRAIQGRVETVTKTAIEKIEAAAGTLDDQFDGVVEVLGEINRRLAQHGSPQAAPEETAPVRGVHRADVPTLKERTKRKVAVLAGRHQITVPADSKAAATMPRAGVDSQDVLDAVATLSNFSIRVSIHSVAAWIGVHPKTKSLLTRIGQLRADGLLDAWQLSGNGSAVAHVRDAPSGRLRSNFSESQTRIVDTIATLEARGQAVTHIALAAWLGVHPKTKSLLEDLGKLRERGYLDGLSLTEIGRRAAWRCELSTESILGPLDSEPRRIVETVIKHGGYENISELAADLDVHPKTKSLLEGVGKLRDRGLLTKGWPIAPTQVFDGVSL